MSIIKLKRGNNVNFKDIVLEAGEPAFVIDTKKLYVGDGSNKILINPLDKISEIDTTRAFSKNTVNEYGQVVKQENLLESDIPQISHDKISGLGSAALLNGGSLAGNVPILDSNGKLEIGTIPDIALVNTFVVASEAEMLVLNAQQGDVAVRSDVKLNYILKTAPASELNNWVQLLVPADLVTSVNGKQGLVVLFGKDIQLESYSKASIYAPILATDNLNIAIGKLEKNFDNFAPLSNANLLGVPTAPTATSGVSTTQIATTAFVSNAVSIIDGGTF